MTTAIRLDGVSKRYRKYDDTAGFNGVLGLLRTRTSRSWLWALEDIDMVVEPGESVGVVGRNGAGKSTLLQLLCGVTAPTSGRVAVRGRVAPLISVGVGFHQEMTGRENVYVNGTILGMSRKEIDRKFDSIVAFSELEKFIDTPVKFYSSGMFVRLGFAVAVEATPEILLVDEVLAVGDFAFQVRCFERMNQIRASGTTIVVVSHNMNSIRGFCDRAVVLDRGRIALDGSPFEAIAKYYELTTNSRASDEPGADDTDLGAVEIETFALVDDHGDPVSHAVHGSRLRLRMTILAQRAVKQPFLWIGLESGIGAAVYSDARLDDTMPPLGEGERATYEAAFTADLPTGSYTIDAAVRDLLQSPQSTLLARAPRLSFYVTGRPHVHGAADLKADIRVVDPL